MSKPKDWHSINTKLYKEFGDKLDYWYSTDRYAVFAFGRQTDVAKSLDVEYLLIEHFISNKIEVTDVDGFIFDNVERILNLIRLEI